jgi:hypothetical protein
MYWIGSLTERRTDDDAIIASLRRLIKPVT